MQVFGKYKEVHELEYLTKCYIYINKADEKIEVEDVELLLKKKNKNVAGTIFLFNPTMYPLGYKKDEKLQYQDFRFNDKFHELEADEAVRVMSRQMKRYEGKLIEVKYLFNYIKEDIQPTSALEVFDLDLGKLYTNQLTVFAKQDNYHDYKNISYNGKFIFLAWGHKLDKHHTNITNYASSIAQWAKKQSKDVSFMYDGSLDEDDSFDHTRFINPVSFGKMKKIIPIALENIFKEEQIKPFSIKGIKV